MDKTKYNRSIVAAGTQVNNGLEESAACGSSVVYDQKYGLVFLVYMTGTRTSYGESSGRICLSVFSPTQPTNIRFRRVDDWLGGTRGVLCMCAWLIGDAKIRMLFTTTKGQLGAFYRDYDFLTDTLSDRMEAFFEHNSQQLTVNNDSYRAILADYGFSDVSDAQCIINKSFVYNDEVYTAVTLDAVHYPLICKIKDNLIIPFACCPKQGRYEFRCYVNETGIHGVYRHHIDDHDTGKTGYAFSPDNGQTWQFTDFEDGIQSRPDILPYYGKPLIIYNYADDSSIENFPHMHHNRNAIKILYDGKILFRCFEKYGIVEHTTINIYGDLYMAFSTCEQALSVATGNAKWIEHGFPVEQGKEEIKWVKLGYLLEKDAVS